MYKYRSRIASQLDAARRVGTLDAYRLREKIGLKPTERVDIFRIIVQAGIWLRFAPLNRLFGAYQRSGNAAGILLHAGHPLHLQRLTAAHEFGHHVLNHSLSVDEEAEIDGTPSSDPQEQEAFAFASTLLIPLDGVYAKLPTSWRPGRSWLPSPEAVYTMSGEFGVSYRALVVQLTALNVINWRQAEELRKASPLEIKRSLGSGWEPANPRLTVWRFGISDSGQRVTIDIGDEIHLYLPPDRDAKFQWSPEGGQLSRHMRVLSDELLSARIIVSPDLQHIVLRAIEAGEVKVSFLQGEGLSAQKFCLSVTVLLDERPQGEGLHLLQQEQLAACF